MSSPADDEASICLNPTPRRLVPEEPWRDDTLQRRAIAAELSTLAGQLAQGSESAAIALDGGYGTGKTFILERWVAEMQEEGQVAVYYNAWENDCDDDPLVSLVETLVANDKTDWAKTARASLNEALAGLAHKFTGIDQRNMRLVAKSETGGLLDAASARRSSRQKLKDLLAELVDGAKEESFGVVVVIDELDRCRPTFAAELVERVKHVLNVPGLVFVFGMNMMALRETMKAAYGNIDAHQYLVRVFATTLRMPLGVIFDESYRDEKTLDHLKSIADRQGLLKFCARHQILQQDIQRALSLLGLVSASGRMTPREMEHVVWLLSKVASSSLAPDGQASAMPALVLVPLAVARVKVPEAYYETVQHLGVRQRLSTASSS